jgi:hypothetical protein
MARETASLTLERFSRQSATRTPLSAGLERPVTTLPPPAAKSWPRLPPEIVISSALILLAACYLVGVLCFDHAPVINIAAIPVEPPIALTKSPPLKVEPVDEAMLAMIAPAMQPAGAVAPGLHLTIAKDPDFSVRTASLKDIESQVKSDPADPEAQLRLGAAYAEASAFEKAAAAYARAYDLDPASARSTFNLAVTLEHLNKKRQAIYYYAKTMDNLGLNPGAPENADIPVDTVRARLASLTK